MKVSRLIELLQEFEKTYGDLIVYAGARRVLSVDRVNDTAPNNDEIGEYFMGGVCMIQRERSRSVAGIPAAATKRNRT
jgi:hypothetical protein